MTIKYQRPAGAHSGVASLANRDKYQQDSSSQPKVAISSSKMDGDFNYIVDALNEIDEASGSQSSIASRLSVAMNDDGSLRASASLSLDDWVVHSVTTLARVSDTSISFDGDYTGVYPSNKRIKFTVSGSDYFASISSSNYNGTTTTTLTLADVVDSSGVAAVVSAAPSALYYSPLLVGVTGNSQNRFSSVEVEELKSRLNGGMVRFIDESGTEFALRSQTNKLQVLENTGTEVSPAWVVRAEVDSNGFVFSNNSVAKAKLEQVAAMKVLGNASGATANVAEVSVLDEDDMLSDSATALATQQSIKAYVTSATPDASTGTKGLTRYSYTSEVRGGVNLSSVLVPAYMKYHLGVGKMWMNFDSSTGITIRDDHNVSSILDNGVGDFTIYFTESFASANYAWSGSTSLNGRVQGYSSTFTSYQTTGALRIQTTNSGTTAADFEGISIMAMGDV